MKRLMILAAAASLTAFATAQDSEISRFSIRTFYGFTTGDVKDDVEIDNVYGVGFEYKMPNNTMKNGSWHLGAEYATSSKNNDLTLDNYGLYLGAEFALDKNEAAKFSFVANVGMYTSVLHATGGEAAFKNGFGWDAGFRYKMNNVTLEFLYRVRPDIAGSDLNNQAFAFGVCWPVK